MATALREVLARFGVSFDDRQLRRGTRSIGQAVNGLRSFAAAIGGAVLVRGIGRFVSETIRIGDEFDKVSQQIGIAVEQYNALTHAANLAGVDNAALANGLGILQRRANDAATGSQEAIDGFRQLGVEFQDTNGELLSAQDLMANVADGMASMENPAERVALSMELMGRSGRRMIPMLSGGSEALREAMGEAEGLTGNLDEFTAVSVDLTDNLFRWQQAMLGVRARMAVTLLPIIDRAVRSLTRFSVAIREVTEGSHLWEIAMVALGVAAVALGIKLTLAFAGPLLTFGLIAAALLIIGLVIDDLWVAIEGGDSVIGSAIDELLAYIGVWFRFRHMVQEVRTALNDLWEFLQAVGQFFTGVFGGGPEGPEGTAGQMIRRGFEIGRSVREFVSPGERREGAAFRAGEARTAAARARRTRRAGLARAREAAGGAIEGEVRTGAPIVGPGGRILGRQPSQVMRGGRWINVGDTTTTVNVTTAASDPEEVGRVVRREVVREGERQRRRTLAAAEGAG